MGKAKIRRVRDKDLSAVLSLYTHLETDNGQVLSVERAQRILTRIKSYPDYRIYVATADGEIIGTVALLIMDKLAHMGAKSGIVEDMVVHPTWQGRGIGKQMMQFAMDRCRDKGCYKLALSSNIVRKEAHRFYESLGFKRHGYSYKVDLTRKRGVSSEAAALTKR